MRKIKILGTGCARCRQMEANAKAAAKEVGIDYELEKVTDLHDIISAGVMTTPALIVDGEVKVAGKVPSIEEMKKILC
ncbi:MAG: thioredoxin family protein [Candidatus Schekmanbacteria bacterium]|nr:MAG: thioredoxin family protein [Candidatus Schekmanbacteria bacterium]